jgi:hypothetical protein
MDTLLLLSINILKLICCKPHFSIKFNLNNQHFYNGIDMNHDLFLNTKNIYNLSCAIIMNHDLFLHTWQPKKNSHALSHDLFLHNLKTFLCPIMGGDEGFDSCPQSLHLTTCSVKANPFHIELDFLTFKVPIMLSFNAIFSLPKVE